MDSMFKNRLEKNFNSHKKWAKRENVTAFRIYDKDIPEYSYSIDYYDGSIVVYEYERGKASLRYTEEYMKADKEQLEEVILAIKTLFEIDESKIFLKLRKRQKGLFQYERQDEKEVIKIVSEGDMKFKVNLSDYLDSGLFLDHRKTRQIVKKNATEKKVLNLFAYTGSVSIAAALGNAEYITTVDMSNTYLKWAEENFNLNKIPVSRHEFIRADIMSWLPTVSYRSKKYDFIFLDPPSFSNSKKMHESFDVQKDYIFLLNQCEKLLNSKGKILFSCNLRSFKIDKNIFTDKFDIEDLTKKTIPKDFRNERIHHAWMLTKKI
ncbi:class I SAM-dependent methyltransferase [Fluviispira multicolorata]|uniref:Methyltransferase n=1 Tax=Fluviispira multicolorata TaxID=2654512 RepID=A0A833JAU4_9BACT|nr:class I SAM-dependent methyltransferase [Fluviispira multicolorata]KAB8027740.1 methyltransferase [Fluviispira multicolorata]